MTSWQGKPNAQCWQSAMGTGQAISWCKPICIFSNIYSKGSPGTKNLLNTKQTVLFVCLDLFSIFTDVTVINEPHIYSNTNSRL